MKHTSALCRRFVDRAKDALRSYPDLEHDWTIETDKGHCALDFPVNDPNGFGVKVDVSENEVFVSLGGAHCHFEPHDTDEDIDACISMILDLLGPGMRVREKRAGGRPYSWTIEKHEGDCWQRQEVVGLVFFNYFGRRSEKIYQNTVLVR